MLTHINNSVNEFLRLRYECSKIHMICADWSQAAGSSDLALTLGARLSWSLGRTLTGWLREQPDWRIHPRAPLAHHALLRLMCRAISWQHRSAEARRAWLTQRFGQLGRDLRDIRAITSSREINSVIGRYESLLRSAQEATTLALEANRSPLRLRTVPERQVLWSVTHDWPYLAV